MLYAVQARFIPSTAQDFLRTLTDGTTLSQKPDGREIVASMRRARVAESGLVRWTETCFCSPPLYHERTTVYDQYFVDLETRPINRTLDYAGEPFMEYLARIAASSEEDHP